MEALNAVVAKKPFSQQKWGNTSNHFALNATEKDSVSIIERQPNAKSTWLFCFPNSQCKGLSQLRILCSSLMASYFSWLRISRTNKVVFQQPSTEIKCTDCGKTATVPFKPIAGKPVYCRDCLAKHRTKRADTGGRMETKKPEPDAEKQAWSRRRENWKN